MLWLFESKFVPPNDPHRVVWLEDLPETWERLLNDPEVIVDEDSKRAASALCGARYFEGVSTRDKENVEAVEALVLDVDVPDRTPPAEALQNALSGYRSVVYASPSHTTAAPRWRVVLPLLTPLPPKKYRSLVQLLSEGLVPGYEGCIDVDSTGDPCRLGFVGVTKHPEDYTWWSTPGVPLDWTGLPLEDEVWSAAPLGGLERTSLWSERSVALKAALKFYATTGQGVGKGEGRTLLLWDVALALWWSWAAEDEDFVMEVLRQVNTNFTEPEEDEEVERKMREAHARAVGERRKDQSNGTYGWRREPSNVVSLQAIQDYAKRMRQRRKPEDATIGEALRRLAKGETLSEEPETWRGLVTKCAHALASAFPTESAERIAAFFRPSLATMKAAGAAIPAAEEVQNFVSMRLAGLQRHREEVREQAEARVQQQIEFATKGARSTKYTRQEIDTWKQSVGLRDNNWILVSKSAFYVFRNGTWVGPYTKDEFEAQGYKDLAAAEPFVRTTMIHETKGVIRRPLKELLHDYGSACTTRCDLSCEKSWFDEDEGVLVLAGPPKRALEPRFHTLVDKWLRVMTGRAEPANEKERQKEASTMTKTPAVEREDDYEVLLDWLASFIENNYPSAALYLEGEHSVGKGLFADGTARIYKTGAIGLDDAFKKFNALFLETPFIWIDEGLPEHVKASVLLRKALAAREFVYERKNIDAGKVTGCIRMLFTANNLDLFNKSKELVKKEDVDALAQRFVHIKVRPESADFLLSISPKHHDFVEKNLLAEHILWLHEKRWTSIKTRGLRFLVEGRSTNVSDVVATNSDSTSECVNMICEAILDGKSKEWLAVKKGDVFVSASSLQRALSLRPGRVQQYTEREVVRAIQSICAGESKTVRNGKVMRMWPVRTDSLRAWCDNTRVYVWSEVAEAIEKLASAAAAAEEAQNVASSSIVN